MTHTALDVVALALAFAGLAELVRRRGGGRIRHFLLLAHLGAVLTVGLFVLGHQAAWTGGAGLAVHLGGWLGVSVLLAGSVGLGAQLMARRDGWPAQAASAIAGLLVLAVSVLLVPTLSLIHDAEPIWQQGLEAYQALEMAAAVVGTGAVMAGCVVALRRQQGRARRPLLWLIGFKVVLGTGYVAVRLAHPDLARGLVPLVIALDVAAYRWALLGHRMGGICPDDVYRLLAGRADPMLILDHHGRSLVANEPAKALFGSLPEAPDEIEARLQRVPAFSGGHGPSRSTVVQVGGDPRSFVLQRLRHPEEDLEILLLDDVTDAEAQARALADTTRRLDEVRERMAVSEKMAALGALAAGVSHEINNPVAYVRSNLQTLEEYVAIFERALSGPCACPAGAGRTIAAEEAELRAALEDAPSALSDAIDGCRRIQEIVTSMRTLSRQNEELEPASLSMLAADAVRVASTTLGGVRLITHLEDPLPISCAPGDLTRVILNLVVNAGQACGPGHTVSVASWLEGRTAVLEVADDGPGIPHELRTRIFEPFFTTKPAGQGTGLGLAISYEIVRNHGGEIRVHSTVGEGSRFQVRLPVDAEKGTYPLRFLDAARTGVPAPAAA